MTKGTTTTILCFMAILFAFTSASNIRGGDRGLLDLRADFEEEGIHQTDPPSPISRHLAATCPYGNGGTVNFNVQTRVIPSLENPTCSDDQLASIGIMINSALLNAGVATYQQSVFLAGVCNTPNVEFNGGKGGTDMVGVTGGFTSGFIWTGGGVSCSHLDIGHRCPVY